MKNYKEILLFIIIIVALASIIVFVIVKEKRAKLKGEEKIEIVTKADEQIGIEDNGQITLPFNQKGQVGNTSIEPKSLVEDSRCPLNTNCIWAGRVSISATVENIVLEENHEFILGEPEIIGGDIITLISISPIEEAGKSISLLDYRMTFKVIPAEVVYKNASIDLIKIESPLPQSVTGKEFEIRGTARGQWFFEGTSRVKILDSNDNVIFEGTAKALQDSMTTDFIPFKSDIKIDNAYIGVAKLILLNDNPSGLPEKESSISFPINIEY